MVDCDSLRTNKIFGAQLEITTWTTSFIFLNRTLPTSYNSQYGSKSLAVNQAMKVRDQDPHLQFVMF